MIVFLLILCVLLLAAAVVEFFLLRRAALRLLQFDDLFQLFVDDIETNVGYFEKLSKQSLISDSEEVKSAHKNMVNMGLRLNEFLLRMEEVTNRRLRVKTLTEEDKKGE